RFFRHPVQQGNDEDSITAFSKSFVLRKAQFNAKAKEQKTESTNHHSLAGQHDSDIEDDTSDLDDNQHVVRREVGHSTTDDDSESETNENQVIPVNTRLGRLEQETSHP
ncbi:Hypothetical predicted protein, partial [Paramuricea clavata]